MISRENIDELKTMMPKVLEHYGILDLRRNFNSPWREDRDPSAVYYPDTNLVHDFGSGETVDVFGLIGKVEEIDRFPDQVQRVADIVGYTLGNNDYVARPAARPPRKRFDPPAPGGFHPALPVATFEEFRDALLQGGRALDYLHGRGFDDAKLYRNCFGFVENQQQVSPTFTCFEPNAPHGFIVMPFPTDERFSEVQYAMLRPVPGEVPPIRKEMRPTGIKSPLYREWLLSHRCKVLYVTEGLLDCLALEVLIYKPCIGLGGTGGANRMAALLYYIKPELRPQKVVLALDADEAGRKAAEELADDLDCIGIPHSNLQMPEGCNDPNDVLMQTGGE